MSSDSESDEQFESADEDFETEDPKYSVPHLKKSDDEILHKLADLSLKETSKPLVFDQVNDTTNKTQSCDKFTVVKSLDNESNIEKTFPNSSKVTTSPKSKVLLCDGNKDPNMQSLASNKPLKAIEESMQCNTKESTVIIKNSKDKDQNVCVTNERTVDFDGWDVDNDSDISDLLPKTTENVVQSENNTSESNETIFPSPVVPSKDTSEVGDHVISKQGIESKTSSIDNVSGDTGVDGWDVEVEDGFEIPVNLNKNSSPAVTTTDRFPFSLTSPLHKLTDGKEDSWGGWGSWGGVGNILSTATSGVTTLTSQVSHGFSQVLGAPDPAELAKLDKELSEQRTHQQHNAPKSAQDIDSVHTQDTQGTALHASDTSGSTEPLPQHSADPGGLFSLSHLTRLVETTGSKVIAGGLDTLENLGKKTMEVLQDGDPGLKKKRAILFPQQDKPVLSQVLREAKGRLESEDLSCGEPESLTTALPTSTSSKNLHFETLLDDYQGLAHLEALEILSKQCSVKLHNALMAKSGDEHRAQELNDFQETLQQIREMCQVEDATDPTDSNEDDDDDDEEAMGFEEKVDEIVRLYDLTSKLNCDKLIQVNKKITLQMDRLPLESSCDAVYGQCLRSMAEFTSVAMELFHKCASLLLLKSKHSTVDETDALTQLTHLLCSRMAALSSAYSQAMLKLDKDTALITNVYLEAANSCSYLQDASQLLIPVLQIVAIPGAS